MYIVNETVRGRFSFRESDVLLPELLASLNFIPRSLAVDHPSLAVWTHPNTKVDKDVS